MKYSFITIFMVIISLIYIGFVSSEREYKPFEEVLEKIINTSRLKTYNDSLFGYEAKYPNFFEKEPDSLREYPGDAKFSFSNVIQIDLETTVSRNWSANARSGIDSIARKLHAKVKTIDKDSFILTGQLYENDNATEGYSFYSKYVAKDKLWLTYSVYYPDTYKRPIKRLFDIIDHWKPYKEFNPLKKKFILNRRYSWDD
ncbi:MAG TPA: hypothetical protein PLF38_09900 [Xylanibacter oryzae]|nr:hypothetical protein [Xylanibacter oryzae]